MVTTELWSAMQSAAYVRVSSKGQDHAMLTTERAAANRGESIGEWYAEKRSARAMARPELDQLRASEHVRCPCSAE